MQKLSTLAAAILLAVTISAQSPIDVTEQTIKIKGTSEETMLFGFASGDKILFSFEEVNNKDLKEVEITEYPSTSRFSDFKTSKLTDREILVARSGVYKFRFKNGAISGRVCRIHIKRIPASATTADFNTTVRWIDKQDTTWNVFTSNVIVRYDTTYVQRQVRELVNTEQREEMLFDKMQRVHSETNANGNRTSVFFTLPQAKVSDASETKVVAWAYWIGVGEEANKAWQLNMKATQSLITAGAKLFTTPLGALAIGALSTLLTPTLGHDVSYSITNEINKTLFLQGMPYRHFDGGKGIAGYRKFTEPSLCKGAFNICLANDNFTQGIDAQIKVVAIIETKTYQTKQDLQMHLVPQYEKQIKKEPIIRTTNMPVAGI